MQVTAISDTHMCHRELELEPGEILVHAGDALGYGIVSELMDFIEWLSEQPFKHKIYVAGNHDKCLQTPAGPERKEWMRSLGIHYLENDYVEIASTEGGETRLLGIYGSPVTPRFGKWSFMEDRHALPKIWSQYERVARTVPVDLLVTHGPPYGHGDWCRRAFGDGHIHTGDLHLMTILRDLRSRAPQAHVFGHIHEGHGWTTSEEVDTVFYNVSIKDGHYKTTHKPTVLRLRGRNP